MKKRLVPIVLAVPLLLAGCSDDAGEAVGETPVETSATQTTDSDAPGYTNVLGSVGETVVAGGVTITVNDVVKTHDIEVMESPYPEANTRTETAPDGHKYVEVDTTVENSSGRPWDLTCAQPIVVNLADKDGSIYMPVRDAYEVPGNPECNTMLNPGLTANMTWRFEVPESVAPEYFGFSEPEVNYENPYFVDISAV